MSEKFSFAIIGSQKAGSTSLHNALKCHSEIVFQKLAEYPGFEIDFNAAVSEVTEWAEQLPLQKVFGIKRPSLLGKPDIVLQMFQALPHLRFITTIRHPIDRTVAA